jgi:hypothetical protein
MLISALAVVLGISLTAAGQAPAPRSVKLEPMPDTIKSLVQPESPVELTLDGVYPSPGSFRLFQYTIRNRAAKEIRNIIILSKRDGVETPFTLGLPATLVNQFAFEAGLKPGMSKTISHPLNGYENKPATASEFSVDFVIFKDGTTWGPNAANEAERIFGLYEGIERLIAEVKSLQTAKRDDELKALILRDGPPAGIPDVSQASRRDQSVSRGHWAARLMLRSDLLGRGDLNGVSARVADLRRQLDLGQPERDGKKQVTIQYKFNSPLKFVTLARNGNDVAFDERFAAAGDWLTGLKLKLRNDSDRPIKAVSLMIYFPETINSGPGMSSSLLYRPHPITGAEKTGQGRVAPGQLFEIVVDSQNPGELMRFLSTRQESSSISRVIIELSHIDYEDGLRWGGGQWQKRDPENPQRWIRVEK